jgi:hypothetical protein
MYTIAGVLPIITVMTSISSQVSLWCKFSLLCPDNFVAVPQKPSNVFMFPHHEISMVLLLNWLSRMVSRFIILIFDKNIFLSPCRLPLFADSCWMSHSLNVGCSSFSWAWEICSLFLGLHLEWSPQLRWMIDLIWSRNFCLDSSFPNSLEYSKIGLWRSEWMFFKLLFEGN